MLLVLGGWLLFAADFAGYDGHAQAKSDLVCGLIILGLACVAALVRRPWISWIAGAVGGWLILAPVVLHTLTLGAYIAGTATGMLVLFEGLVLPLSWKLPGDEVPAGWHHDPSSWQQRTPILVLAAIGLVLAGYVAAYQLELVDTVWDPVFGAASMRLLDRGAAPVSLAGIGAVLFALDLVLASAGDRHRWRTLPWVVLLFGALAIPIGLAAAIFVVVASIAVGAWSSWSLLAAAVALLVIPLAIDEVLATVELLRRFARHGDSWWRVLWRGAREQAQSS